MRFLKVTLLAACLLAFSRVAAAAAPADDYTRTRYPIVLVHGMLGFDTLFDAYTYWYGIAEGLRSSGAEVFVLSLSPLNRTEVRGEQALTQLETLMAVGGYEKVNLIGHSQGGLDIRYVAAAHPEWVASLTTISTPHQGADLADYLLSGPTTLGDRLFLHALSALGLVVSGLSHTPHPSDRDAALRALSSPAAVTFNHTYPWGVPTEPCGAGAFEDRGIYYFSWSGVATDTNRLDWLDGAWRKTSTYYRDANDGLVTRCSSHFGKVLRDDYHFNHLDTINQMLGLVGKVSGNPVELYRVHANRLKHLGL